MRSQSRYSLISFIALCIFPILACATTPQDNSAELNIRRACMGTPVQPYEGYSKAKEDFLCVCVAERFTAGVQAARDVSPKKKQEMFALAEAFYKNPPADGAVIRSNEDPHGVAGSILDYISKCEKTWSDQQKKN